jgi:hypothetical protein
MIVHDERRAMTGPATETEVRLSPTIAVGLKVVQALVPAVLALVVAVLAVVVVRGWDGAEAVGRVRVTQAATGLPPGQMIETRGAGQLLEPTTVVRDRRTGTPVRAVEDRMTGAQVPETEAQGRMTGMQVRADVDRGRMTEIRVHAIVAPGRMTAVQAVDRRSVAMTAGRGVRIVVVRIGVVRGLTGGERIVAPTGVSHRAVRAWGVPAPVRSGSPVRLSGATTVGPLVLLVDLAGLVDSSSVGAGTVAEDRRLLVVHNVVDEVMALA